ncbi:hypothetical protein ACLB1Q_20515 [Escherichia coli]
MRRRPQSYQAVTIAEPVGRIRHWCRIRDQCLTPPRCRVLSGLQLVADLLHKASAPSSASMPDATLSRLIRPTTIADL